MNERHICITYIVKSKTGSKEMRVIHFDQDVQVCGIFSNPNIFWYSFDHDSLFLIIALEVWAISFFQYFGTFMCSILFLLFFC
jgi:hypothetical protein